MGRDAKLVDGTLTAFRISELALQKCFGHAGAGWSHFDLYDEVLDENRIVTFREGRVHIPEGHNKHRYQAVMVLVAMQKELGQWATGEVHVTYWNDGLDPGEKKVAKYDSAYGDDLNPLSAEELAALDTDDSAKGGFNGVLPGHLTHFVCNPEVHEA